VIGLVAGFGVEPAHAACDVSGSVSISDARHYEGTGAGTTNLVFTVSGFCSDSVDYTTINGDAKQPDDYTKTEGTAVLQGGIATITVPVVRDSLDEPNHSFWIQLSNAKHLGGLLR
jgi:hypothetical protein